MANDRLALLAQEIKKSRRRCWFGTMWKPQPNYIRSKMSGRVSDDSFEKDIKYRQELYDKFGDLCRAFEAKITGVKWAYAYHNKGHNEDNWKHDDCEHLHFVVITENAVSGSSMLKYFPRCHLEIVKYDVSACALYLLHLTASSRMKEKIDINDLYCSGAGIHGQLWFSLVPSTMYDTFIPNEVMHYVYNDGIHSVLEFASRFGASVLHGAYGSMIRSAIDMWERRTISKTFFFSIFSLLDEKTKDLAMGAYDDNWREKSFDDLFKICTQYPIAMDFTRIYIWWKNSVELANPDILGLLERYGLSMLIHENDDRIRVSSITSQMLSGQNDSDALGIDDVEMRLANESAD